MIKNSLKAWGWDADRKPTTKTLKTLLLNVVMKLRPSLPYNRSQCITIFLSPKTCVTVTLMAVYMMQLDFASNSSPTDFSRTLRLQPSCIRDQDANHPLGYHKGSTKEWIYLSSWNRSGRKRNISVFNLEFTYIFPEHRMLFWENCQLFIWVLERNQGQIKAIRTFWSTVKC